MLEAPSEAPQYADNTSFKIDVDSHKFFSLLDSQLASDHVQAFNTNYTVQYSLDCVKVMCLSSMNNS